MRRFFTFLLKVLLGLGLLAVLAVVGAIVALRVPSVQTRLAHKAADVMSEVRMVGERVAELADLLAQVKLPAPAMADDFRTAPATYDGRGVAIVASEERES